MANERQYTSAEYRKFAKQIVIMTIIFEVGMYGYLAVTGNLDEDFALQPLLAIPAAVFGVVLMLVNARRADQD